MGPEVRERGWGSPGGVRVGVWGQRSQRGQRSQIWWACLGSEVTRSGVGGQLLGSEVRNGGHSAEVTVWGQRSPFGVRGHSSGMVFGVGGHGWRSEVTIWGQRSQCEVRGRGQTWGRSHVTEWGQRSPSGVRGHSGSRGQRLGVRGQRSEVSAVGYVASGGAPGGSSTSCSDGSRYSATAGTETPTLGPTAPHSRPPDPQPHRLYGAGPPPIPPRCSKCSSSPTTAPSAP